jgi:ribosomal protein S27E
VIGIAMIGIEDTATRQRSRFKVVCEDCGGLSIKVEDPAHSPATALVRCGRCNAIRGTLAELHEMARRSTDSFEF